MSTLTFGILGPLVVHRSGVLCRIGRPKSRQLLATLLLHPNRFVSTDLITDVLWGEAPPSSASANIRTYVHTLRNLLTEPDGTPLIDTHSSGYSINVSPEALDSSRLRALAMEAERLSQIGDEPGALTLWELAHQLWRGPVLDDLPVAQAWQVALDDLGHTRRQMLDRLVDLWLRFDQPQAACAMLRKQLADDPCSESLWRRYIATLATTGRTEEARRAVGEMRATLSEELGLAPGQALRQLEQQLAREPTVSTSGADEPDPPTPSQLPRDLDDFTGREEELQGLRTLIVDHTTRRPPVVVLSGPPGVGKTALAVRLGHLLRDRFPDGQLFLPLHATSAPPCPLLEDEGSGEPTGPDCAPRAVFDALAELLSGLRIPDESIPADQTRRSALLRSELATRRMLIVLDDAASARQVAPLLPGVGRSAVLVTSRSQLTDLTGVSHQTLNQLDDDEAAALLRHLVGEERAHPDAETTSSLVRACGGLPLAIRIAGSRLVQRRGLSAGDLAARLADERQRLDELAVGSLALRPRLDASYRILSHSAARLYHVLGALGARELPGWLVHESGIDRDPEQCVGALVEANLVQAEPPARPPHDARGGVYRMPGLVRCHAREKAMTAAAEQTRGDLGAIMTLLLSRSAQMAEALPTRFFGVTLSGPPPAAVTTEQGPGDGPPPPSVEWFDAHVSAFPALVAAAAEHGLDKLAWQLAVTWAPYLDLRGCYDEWAASHSRALACVQRVRSRRGEAIVLRNLGQLALYRDEYDTAERSLTRSYRLFASVSDVRGCGVAAAGLGTYHRVTDNHKGALRWFHTALGHFVSAVDQHGEAMARNAIARIWLQRKRPAQAEPWLHGAFTLSIATGDRHREAQVRRLLAMLREQQSDTGAAIAELRIALDTLTAIGDDHCACYVQRRLGRLLIERGEFSAAHPMLTHALEVGHRLGDRRAEALAALQLGRLHRAMGDVESAQECFHRARRAWRPVVERIRSGRLVRPPTPGQEPVRRARGSLGRVRAGATSTDCHERFKERSPGSRT